MKNPRRARIPTLPNDVIVEILTLLPVKPLLKFKCVCKSWRTLISSQEFVRAHLRNSAHLLITWEVGDKLKQCSADSGLYKPLSEASHLSWPLESGGFRVVGWCNGLLCLLMNDDHGVEDYILWNPSTRIWKKLPHSRCCCDYGFGFDKSSDDYKLVGFSYERIENSDTRETIVQVYSLRNDKWTRVKNFVEDTWEFDDGGTFANGKLYWVVLDLEELEKQDFSHIVCFDFEKEESEIVQIPSYVNLGDKRQRVTLGASEGSLLVLCNRADVWIVDCRNNWSKLVTIPRYGDHYRYYYGVLHVKHGRILLRCNGTDLAIFDAKDCSISYPEVKWSEFDHVFPAYLESLVSPLG